MSKDQDLARHSMQYQARVLEQKVQDDQKEIAIREKVRTALLKEEWAQQAFKTIGDLQVSYLKNVVAHVDDEKYVHDKTQEVLHQISQLEHSTIVEGAELLEMLPKRSAVLIATNHFGAYKLCGVDSRKDIGVNIPGYDAMYPYPMYFAALYPVAAALDDGLYYASNDFPGIFGEIHTKAGFIHVPALAESKTAALIEQTREVTVKRPNAAIVNFPEGTTSGKPTGGGPYDLNPFKTGGYVIAGTLNMYVVPVAQYFDTHKGFQLRVFEPIIPQGKNKEEYERIAEDHRSRMQAWFDERMRS